MTNIPRVDEPNLFDEPGMANTLRAMLLAMMASAIAISALTLFLRWRHTSQLALMCAASCLVALMLSRWGWIRWALFLPLLSITYTVLHSAARSSGIENIGLAILPVLIMLASLALGRLGLVLFSTAEILAIVAMLAIRYFVLQAERYSSNDMGDLFVFALTCATAALLGRLFMVRIKEGLRLARDSERRYRRIFENVQDVYYEMNMDGILLELNPASSALFGMPREEMIGRALTPFCETVSEFDVLRAAVRAKGRVSNCELVIRDSSAVFHHVLVNASLQTGSIAGEERVIGSIRDISERKRAEEALRESERTFRELLEGVQLVAVVTASNGKISFCNDYALAITGWSKEEVIGRAAKELLDPELPHRVADQTATAPPAGKKQPFFEGSILQKNGGRRWIQWSSTPVRDLAGSVAGFASLGEDVTELRTLRAEAAKRESEERFRDLANTAPVMIWVSGPDKLCTFFNEPWLDFTGRTMEQEMGHGWSSGIHPDDLDRCLATYSSSFDARCKFQMEYRLRRADGEYHWLLDNGTPFYRDTEFVGFIGSCIDITERRQAEEALRESEEQFRRVFEEGPLGVALVGKDYRFVKVNSALCRMVGYSEAELLQRSFVDITHPDDVQADVELAGGLFKGEIPFYQLQKRYVKKNDEIIWIKLTASILRDQRGEPSHGLAMIEDITELKRIQEEAFTRQKLESLGTLAGGIAHDFNNLLGGILSQTESIEQDLSEGSPQIEELHRIKEAAIRGSEIVRELMIYSGQDKADLEPVDLARLVEEMLALLKVSVSKHAVLTTDLPKDLPAVRGNAPQLRQLVMNLVINASEAIGETDRMVRVSLSRVAPGQDRASNDTANRSQSDCLRLEVSDTGSGMTKETQARIFDPFYTTKFAGRGLGLAVVRSIVSSHGGAINVVSMPGQGTTFQIDLPCTGEPSNLDGSDAVATSNARISGIAGTVLLVEDEDLLRRPVSKMLRKHGFSVIEAADGSAALELVRSYRNSIEVILLDLTIPGAPSSEVVAEARRIRPGVKVVLMSAYSREMAPPALNVPEVKGFIRKPFEMGDLVQLLRDIISAERN